MLLHVDVRNHVFPATDLGNVRPTSTQRLTASFGLSFLFLVIYGSCNWIAAHRADVGTINFAWERDLPFLPVMIVPYMSIDLFFIAAPFLCRTDIELRVFVKRIAMAIIVAGFCFLLFPLRFAFPRPHATGAIGIVFDWFRGLDRPHNLFPSLHITLCTLLAQTYSQHTRGLPRVALCIWFGLIAASAVLTYQHHVLDVVGGFALAGYCFYFLRDSEPAEHANRNFRIGLYYATGALLMVSVALLFWPWGAACLWPAAAIIIVASGYFGAGARIYHKTAGRLPLSTRWALGPCLAGQYLSLIYYRRLCDAWNEVTSRVWIGRVLSNAEARAAVDAGVRAVLDVTAEFSAAKAFRSIRYRNVAILDLTAPTTKQLHEIVDFIREESEHGAVYVHCKVGYSRSAAAVGAYLLASNRAQSVDEALAMLRQVRPSIIVRPEIIAALSTFKRDLARRPAVASEAFVLASNDAGSDTRQPV
jgi:predicted protein tyrosine phosphatase/membrane-associated phospholipid phosphatase